jgi:hypothetical protein
LSAVQSRLIAAGLIFAALVLLGFSLRPLLLDANPDLRRVNGNVNGATLVFEFRPGIVLLPTSCYDVEWQIANVDAVQLNGERRSNRDAASLCGTAQFVVRFSDGSQRTFNLMPNVRIATPASLIIGLVGVVVLVWQAIVTLGKVTLTPLRAGKAVLDAVFTVPDGTALSRVVTVAGIVLLFGVGLVHWSNFFNDGNVNLNIQDWLMTRRYWEAWVIAGENGELPFFTQEGIAHTDHFIGDPDPGWNPLLLLFRNLSPGQFALLNTWVFYSIASVGLLLLKRRYRLSLLTFSILFLLFQFNGFITSHMAVGHFTWLGYFFMPFMLLYILEMCERDERGAARAGLKTGVVLAAMALFGAFHFMIWWVIPLVVLALSNRTARAGALLAIFSGFLLSAYRFAPVAFSMGDYALEFRTGFPTLQHLLEGLTVIRPANFIPSGDVTWRIGVYKDLDWWEYNMYVGVLGAVFIAVFGVLLRFWRLSAHITHRFQQLDLPIAVTILFSFGTLYSVIGLIPLPLLNTERVTTRFFIIPLLLLLVMACLRFDRLLPRLAATALGRVIVLGSVWLTAYSLGLHAYVWRVSEVVSLMPRGTHNPLTSAAVIPLANKTLTLTEQLYVLSFPLGILLSVVMVFVWLFLYRRLAPRPQSETPSLNLNPDAG